MSIVQKVTHAEQLPTGFAWRFEQKWDGIRVLARTGSGADVVTSGGNDVSHRYPEVVAALAEMPDDIRFDGELVAFDEHGDHSVQSAAHLSNGRSKTLVVFDIIVVAGLDSTGLAWADRRSFLEHLWNAVPEVPAAIALSPVFDDGAALLATMVDQGREGVVAKRTDSRWVAGSRDGWVAVKPRFEQEFVVIGWTPGAGRREGIAGAICLAVNDPDGRLRFVGSCGTGGGTDAIWRTFSELPELEGALGLTGPPVPPEMVWVEPTTVVQVAFQRWTEGGLLWHPALLVIREDKDAGDVVAETPIPGA